MFALSSSPAQNATRPSHPAESFYAQFLPWLLLVMGMAIVFIIQIRHFKPFYIDDGFISLRYSERLLQGKGLTWNDMRPVEGYTNLLWVLACAGLGAIGLPLAPAAVMLGIACAVIGMAAVVAYSLRDYSSEKRLMAAAFGCGALVLSGPVSLWAQSAMEQAMLAAFLGWAIYFALRWVAAPHPSLRDTASLGILLGLVCLTRADGAVFTAGFVLGGLLADGVSIRSIFLRSRMAIIPAVFAGAQVFFRRVYYGEWVPNTAYVKVAFTLGRLHRGINYDFQGIGLEAAFFLLAVIGLAALWRNDRRRQALFLIGVSITWLAYMAIIGGDIFPYSRHFVPLLEILAFAIAGCSLFIVPGSRFFRSRVAALCLLLGLVLTSDLYWDGFTAAEDGKSVAAFLSQAFGDKNPLMSLDGAGAVPFYTNFPAIDPLGLNDYHIARHKTGNFGKGILGHELADGSYVLDQRPDLVFLCDYWASVCFESDRQILQDPRFAHYYQLMRFDTDPPHVTRAAMYIRRLDGKLGIHQIENTVVIPAYLSVEQKANSIRLVDGRAQLVLPAGGSAEFRDIPVPPGLWSFHVRTKYPSAVVVSDLNSNSERAIGTAFAANQPTLLPEKIGFAVENRSESPVPIEAIYLDRK
jgi:arabinofuranosyltransferase